MHEFFIRFVDFPPGSLGVLWNEYQACKPQVGDAFELFLRDKLINISLRTSWDSGFAEVDVYSDGSANGYGA